jgi:hypothetical protein
MTPIQKFRIGFLLTILRTLLQTLALIPQPLLPERDKGSHSSPSPKGEEGLRVRANANGAMQVCSTSTKTVRIIAGVGVEEALLTTWVPSSADPFSPYHPES